MRATWRATHVVVRALARDPLSRDLASFSTRRPRSDGLVAFDDVLGDSPRGRSPRARAAFVPPPPLPPARASPSSPHRLPHPPASPSPRRTLPSSQRPRPSDASVRRDDVAGAVCASWHPVRALCAVSVGRRAYLLDGVTGAILAAHRLPHPVLALAHAPAALGARLVAILADASAHVLHLEGVSRPRAGRVAAGTNDPASAPTNDRRAHVAFSGDERIPLVVFALPGDATLRAASLRGGGGGDGFSGGISEDSGFSGGDLGSLDGDGLGSFSDGQSSSTSPRGSSSGAGTSLSERMGFRSSGSSKTAAREKQQLLRVKGEHKKGPVAFVEGHPSRAIVFVGYEDGAIRAYDLRSKTCVGAGKAEKPPKGKGANDSNAPACAAALDRGGDGGDDALVVGDRAGALAIWPMGDMLLALAHVEAGGSAADALAIGGESQEDPGVRAAKAPANGGGFLLKPMPLAAAKTRPAVARGPGAPVLALAALPNGVGVATLAGVTSPALGGSRGGPLAAASAPAAFRVDAKTGFERTDDPSAWGIPPLPPSPRRVAVAAHPAQPRVAFVAVGKDDAHDHHPEAARGTPSPPFTVVLARRDPGGGGGRVAFEMVCPEHVAVASAAAPAPPPRRADAYALGDGASSSDLANIWRVDLADASGGALASGRLALPNPNPREAAAAAATAVSSYEPVRVERTRLRPDDASAAFLVSMRVRHPAGPPLRGDAPASRVMLVLAEDPAKAGGKVRLKTMDARDAAFAGENDATVCSLDADGRTVRARAVRSPDAERAAYAVEDREGNPAVAERLFEGPTNDSVTVVIAERARASRAGGGTFRVSAPTMRKKKPPPLLAAFSASPLYGGARLASPPRPRSRWRATSASFASRGSSASTSASRGFAR